MTERLKVLWPHIVAFLLIVFTNIAYFFPQLQGKVISQVDIVSSKQGTKALKEYEKENDRVYLWNPAEFSGMPILSGAPSSKNLVVHAYTILKLGFKEPLGLFIAGGLMTYIMFIILGFSPWLSLIFTIPVMLASNNILLWEAGHNSKIRTLIFTPLIIAGVLTIFEKKKYLLGLLFLALGFSMSFFTRHPQMTYYVLLFFLVYGIIFLIQTIQNKDWQHLMKGALVVIVAMAIGAGSSATKLWSLYDYSEVTMRGKAILSKSASNVNSASSTVDGLDWDYAMQWSGDWKDVMASIIPGFVGGGSNERVSTKSESFKKFRIKNSPLYWGQLPFTSGPIYLGASLWFFFLMGLVLIKGRLKWWLAIGMLWITMLSMGKHLAWFNQIIFDVFPFYSKFRAPQSILSIAPYFMVVLGAMALQQILKVKNLKGKTKRKNAVKETQRGVLMAYGVLGGLSLFFALIGPSVLDFSSPADATYQARGADVSAFIGDRRSLFTSDSWRTFGIISMLAGFIYLYLRGSLNKTILLGVLGAIILIDFLGVDLRYLGHDKYVSKSRLNQTLTEREIDRQILAQEPDRSKYRVYDASINTYNSSLASAFHNTIGGYHPAKMQRFQDLRDFHLDKINMSVFNMLNAKYFIVNKNGQASIRANTTAQGIGWFVANVDLVNTPDEEIERLNDADLTNTAIVLSSEFGDYVQGLAPGRDSLATIVMTAYEPDVLTYRTNSSKESLCVLSEMWYGPNKGWQAYIDGNPVDHIRANYALRALRVPSGQHEVKFEFRPRSYYVGEPISLISSISLLLLLGYIVFKEYRKDEVVQAT